MESVRMETPTEPTMGLGTPAGSQPAVLLSASDSCACIAYAVSMITFRERVLNLGPFSIYTADP